MHEDEAREWAAMAKERGMFWTVTTASALGLLKGTVWAIQMSMYVAAVVWPIAFAYWLVLA